jgi:hypothetical protein
MNTSPNTPFTAIYTQWLESFRALIPGCAPAGPSEETTRKQEQVAAHQEWEDEGGSVVQTVKPGTKIPF